MKFKIKQYTGTVHTKRPVIKLNQFLRFVPKYIDVHIRYIVNPDDDFSEIQDLIISPVCYLDIRSLSRFVVLFFERDIGSLNQDDIDFIDYLLELHR